MVEGLFNTTWLNKVSLPILAFGDEAVQWCNSVTRVAVENYGRYIHVLELAVVAWILACVVVLLLWWDSNRKHKVELDKVYEEGRVLKAHISDLEDKENEVK